MWNQVTSNKLCFDRNMLIVQKKHLDNLRNVKPRVNNTCPKIPSFLKTRAKQEKIREGRQTVINYENRILLDKMMAIERKPSQLNPTQIKKKSFVPTKSLHIVKKMREWQKINDENRGMIQRLQSARSRYDAGRWDEEEKSRKNLKRNISHNARRFQHLDYSTYADGFGTTRSGSFGFRSDGFKTDGFTTRRFENYD